MDDALKIELIAKHFKEIMHVLGLDLTDESLQGTPLRVAKMYVNEHFKGLDPKTGRSQRYSITVTSIRKCWWRRIFNFTVLASIILCPFTDLPTWHTLVVAR